MHPELDQLLHRRLEVIADHAWRDRAPAEHLTALQEVSEQLIAWHRKHRNEISPRLDHFLSNCSFEKALTYLESDGTWKGH
jgi:hypothetical protein